MAATYKIGEAAALLSLKTYVLRFWETEFPEIAPLRTEKGQRLYTPEHLALLDRIRYLLHERGLTIGGARKVLAEERARGATYVFGANGRVRGLDAEAPAGPGAMPSSQSDREKTTPGAPARGQGGAAASAAPKAVSAEALLSPAETFLSPAAEAALLEDADREEDGASPDMDSKDAAWTEDAPQPFDATDGPMQCNLPGLEDLAAFRASLVREHSGLDSAGREGYGGTEKAADRPKGMLPLFAVARAAFLAGKASGAGTASLEGGGNFIRAEAPAHKKDGGGASDRREDLRAVAFELEAIAALLRAP